MSVCSDSGQSSMGAILTIKHNDSQLCVLYDLSTTTLLTSLMSLQRESENQWMRTASSEWRCAEQSVTISAAGWCDVTSSLTGPCSWHLSTFMRAAKIATMGWALGCELKVQLPLFTSPLLHPLTAPSCHIVRLKVQTSPSDSRPTWKHLCGIMAASSDPVAALSSSRTCVDKALQMTIGWWRPPQPDLRVHWTHSPLH